ncbi:hypothetical protein HED49_12275 [Ochrobactrum daejeonense]|nr:hypothetical protein [Brucella daejeonensis]
MQRTEACFRSRNISARIVERNIGRRIEPCGGGAMDSFGSEDGIIERNRA